MEKPDRETILFMWDAVEEGEPDISTERCAAMVCDMLPGCGYMDVIEAIASRSEKVPPEGEGR